MQMIRWEGLSFTYPGQSVPALHDISAEIRQGSFCLLCGPTGSGKSTLLKQLKKELAPAGKRTGSIHIFGNTPEEMSAFQVGYVMQDPDNQIVMDTVEGELAFGLENLGLAPETIRRRMAETASFFGMEGWLRQKTCHLSGGQKQQLNLASVIAMQPELLLLDEPTAQLDPIAAGEFLQMLVRIHRELGMTVILTEHRFDRVLADVDQVLFLENGRLTWQEDAKGWIAWLRHGEHTFWKALPEAVQTAGELGEKEAFPLTVGQGREWLTARLNTVEAEGKKAVSSAAVGREKKAGQTEPVLEAKGLWYSYRESDFFSLQDASVTLLPGEICAVLGGNGSGKSTLLKVLSGAYRPQRGRVKKKKNLRISMLPQSPKAVFTADTLLEELLEWQAQYGYSEKEVGQWLERLGLGSYKDRHPYDLSGGEQQKAALAKILLLQPDVLLLDEPEKGLDGFEKSRMSALFCELAAEGKSLLFVTHDVSFAARTADRCALVSAGSVVCTETTREFLTGNLFYTTETARMCRGLIPGCILPEDIAQNAGESEKRHLRNGE